MSTIREIFLAEVETYLARSGMGPSEFGFQTMGDPSFVPTLRAGRDPKSSTIDRVRKWMADHPLARRRKAEARSAA